MSLLLLFTGWGDRSDGSPSGGGKKRRRADDDLTEAEVQFMFRKIAEMKAAKTERERVAAAKALEVSLAQAAQDDEAAETISATIQEKRPEAVLKADYSAALRDVSLMTEIAEKLAKIAAEVRREREDEEDVEALLMVL